MERLVRGVSQFQREVFPARKHLFQMLADRQNPQALFVTCADSRVVPQLITQSDPGDLFLCRNAGNMVPPYGEMTGGVSATIEYAVAALEVKYLVVCGHSDCGAMHGVITPAKVAHMPAVAQWLRHGELARRVVEENYPQLEGAAKLEAITKENVIAQIDHLRTHPSVAARCAAGKLELHGWFYRIETGGVEAYDTGRAQFVQLDGIAPPGITRIHSVPEEPA